MKIEKQTTPEAVITELGMRMARRRMELGMTQAEVAEQAGVGKRTVERIEAGTDTQLSTLIRLLSVLDLTERLDHLVPEATVSPMEMLKHQTKPRKRAMPKRAAKPKEPWKWGDEQ
ncbi:MAG: helix-turn-helix domain-containing protein [Planctomycetota bacterium]|nr:helix-turn-helix domain-containing protein [Planctomycetota bacterium]